MTRIDYLVVGSSHAGLAAVDAIRMTDEEGSVMLLSREERPPYSPTVLPHVVTGRLSPEKARLRDDDTWSRLKVTFRPGGEANVVRPGDHHVRLATGEELEYGKLLIATGAEPQVPPIPGLAGVRRHVLRTLEDAEALRDAMRPGETAVIIGGGLIGMHAAETVAERGMKPTVVEALPAILSGAFDRELCGRIAALFREHGVRIVPGTTVTGVESAGGTKRAHLSSGEDLEADLLMVAAGVRPSMGLLQGSGIETDRGVLVDERMRTSVEGVWAAGDVAQAPDFFGRGSRLLPTLTDAVAQGRAAGRDMAGDPGAEPYTGGVPGNTFAFFGHRAFSVGLSMEEARDAGMGAERIVSEGRGGGYQALVVNGGRLVGAMGIDSDLDPGVLAELIRRREDLGAIRDEMTSGGKDAFRLLMSDQWR
jgi:phenylglyoxylate dehydrogenase epsilon subunit